MMPFQPVFSELTFWKRKNGSFLKRSKIRFDIFFTAKYIRASFSAYLFAHLQKNMQMKGGLNYNHYPIFAHDIAYSYSVAAHLLFMIHLD